jgi:GDPmannose 4,6-dehydratase
LEKRLYLGNLDALRDWGHAKDHVRMQWMMLKQAQAEEFVIATGKQYSVREFITWTAAALGLTPRFAGQGVQERACVAAIQGDKARGLKAGDCVVAVDPRYFRPAEVDTLLGGPSKAKEELAWVPEITAQQMCTEMVAADLDAARRYALLRAHGHDVPLSREAGT